MLLPGAWESLWNAGGGHLGITRDLSGQPLNISTMVNFLISFNGWALGKMHEENNNEETLRKNHHTTTTTHHPTLPMPQNIDAWPIFDAYFPSREVLCTSTTLRRSLLARVRC